jgi:hypothetical protein
MLCFTVSQVIRVMRDFGVDLDSNTTRTLLRFLVHTQPSSDLTWKIVRRLYRDKGAALTHIECIAATSLLLRRFPTENKIVSLSMPLYRSENYLVAYPGSLAKVCMCVCTRCMYVCTFLVCVCTVLYFCMCESICMLAFTTAILVAM